MAEQPERGREARLYEAERRARRLEDVQAITDVALSHLELDALLAELLLRVRDILETDTCAVLLLDESGHDLVARAAIGLEGEVEQAVRIPIGQGFAGRVAESKKPIVLDDLAHADVLNPILREKGIASMAGVPLLVRGETIGVLHVGALQPRKFDDEAIDLLQLVADRAALGIERAQLHQEMVRIDEMKLNFVAVASHELRAPAAAIYGVAMTMRGRKEISPAMRETLEQTLYDQAERLRRLTEQLLDMSKLDAKAMPIIPRRVRIHGVIEDAVLSTGREGITIEVPPELEAQADPHVVERVVTNLVANAINYGAPPVVVSAEQRDRHLRIAVEDAGPGVADELVPRLFERFERGGAGYGSGLGLAIARAYARAHGGDLVYDPVGAGARFELIIPTR